MTTLLRGTAQTATWLLVGCSIIWIVAGVAEDRAIVWRNIGVLWLVGWPVLFVGFSLSDLVERSGRR